MTSLPTHKIEMDLNGTGTLVDVSADIDDLAALVHQWGRTDWTSDAPNPGILTFTLRNIAGVYTPGNTGTYSVGVRDGVVVKWTVTAAATTRYRWFKCQTPSLQWDNTNANSSTIAVTCADLLQDASLRTLRTMLDEEVLRRSPTWYWRLDESGDGLDPRPVDSSGNAGPALVPVGTAADFTWAQNSGPAVDDGGGLGINQGLADGASVPNLTTAPSDYLVTEETQSQQIVGGKINLMLWVSPIALVDEQILAIIDTDAGQIALAWRSDIGFRLQTPIVSGGTTGPLIPGGTPRVTNCVQLALTFTGTNVNWTLQVNNSPVTGSPLAFTGTPMVLRNIYIGGGLPALWNGALDGYAGSVSRVAVWAGAAVLATDFYKVGQLAAVELPSARMTRLAAYIGATSTAQGTDRGDLVGRQETAGNTLLDTMCQATRTEDSALLVDGDTSGPWIEPWLYSTQRPASSALTIDLDADSDGPPNFTFDTSGVANTVTVTAYGISVTWNAPSPGQFADRSVTVTSAVTTVGAAQNLAQYRSLMGRITNVQPSTVTVDVGHAVDDLRAALLGLRPGAKITVGNCPSAILGYSSIDSIIVGVQETYTADAAKYTLTLQPSAATTAVTLDDTVLGRLDATADNFLTAGINSTVTSVAVANDSVTHFSTSDVPYTILVDSEQMTVTAVSTAAGTDTLTVTRHANGTTAAAHSAGALVTIAGTGVLIY